MNFYVTLHSNTINPAATNKKDYKLVCLVEFTYTQGI